jgi:hypothetical protein
MQLFSLVLFHNFGNMLTRGMQGNSSREEDEKGEGPTEKSKKGGGDNEGKQDKENAAAATVDAEHEAPPMKETPEQIQEWCSWFAHHTTMETYIDSLLTTETTTASCGRVTRGWFLCWQNLHC